MATIAWIISQPIRSVIVASVTLANGDKSTDLELPNYPQKTIEISGTFGVGGTINVRGKNITNATPANYFALDVHDSDATASTLTARVAAALARIIQNPRFILADVSAGDGTTSLVVTVVAAREG